MYRVFVLFCILIFSAPLIASAQSDGVITTGDILDNPPAEFLDDFFEKLAEGSYIFPETQDSSLVLRRLYSFAKNVEAHEFMTAWQTLINLPDHPAYPLIMDIKHEAKCVNSVVTWFGDKSLKSNFIESYNDIWLKKEGIDEDFHAFKETFSGYASRRESKHPASFILDNVNYYGYSKAPGQPSDSLEFIWHLFKDFSVYSSIASRSGFDYRSDDPAEVSKALMISTADKINIAWADAINKEKIRSGDEIIIIDENLISFESRVDEISSTTESVFNTDILTHDPQPETINYEKFNVFELPNDVKSEWMKSADTSNFEKSVEILAEQEPHEPEMIEIEPLHPNDTYGLEPPEPVTQKIEPEIKEVVVIVDDYEPVVSIPPTDSEVDTENEILPSDPETDHETQYTEEPVESMFVTPDIIVVESDESIEDDPPVLIPIPEVSAEENGEEPLSESVDLLTQIAESTDEKPFVIIPDDDEEDRIIDSEPKPDNASETKQIAEKVKSQIIDVASTMGQDVVELVILWETDPDRVENYDKKETELREKFGIKKEEFLSLLFIVDAFQLENDLGLSFDAFNGQIINALLADTRKFIQSDQAHNFPSVTEDKLLSAIEVLRTGVESRRDVLSIQDASRKAYSRRQSQFKELVTELSNLKNIDISDSL